MFKEFFSKLKPLDEDTLYDLNHIGTFVQPLEKEHLEELLRQKRVKIKEERFPIDTCLPEEHYPLIVTKEKDDELLQFIASTNKRVSEGISKEKEIEFAKVSRAWLEAHLTPQISGLQKVKTAIVSQLVAKKIHILLIGDEQVTQQLLSAAANLAAISSIGTAKELQSQHLLAKANAGLCCISQVQSMQAGDRTQLYTAMEHGYIKIDKGVHHERLASDVCVLAAATTKGTMKANSDVKKLTGLDKTFLGRFHLIFLLPKDAYQVQGAKAVTNQDTLFVKRYLALAHTHTPTIPIELAEKARSEHKGELCLALAKANARLELRDEVLRRDIELAQTQF